MTSVIAVSAGSPATGTTTVAAGLAISLSRHGHRVCLLDADWGPSSAGRLLGIQPGKTLVDLLEGRSDLEQVVQQDVCGVDVVLGDSAAERMSALTSDQLREMARQLSALQHYDYLIVDVAAGQDRTVTSFLEASNLLLFVITPDRKTQDSAYRTLKRLREHRATNSAMSVVNQCRNSIIGSHAYARFREITEFYLHETLPLLGLVCNAKRTKHSGQEDIEKLCAAGSDLDMLAEKIQIRKDVSSEQSMQQFWKRYLEAADIHTDFSEPRQPETGFVSLEAQLDNLSHRVEALISRVSQCKEFKHDTAAAERQPVDTAVSKTVHAADYWLDGLNYCLDPEADEAGNNFYLIRQKSGNTLRCAYYRPG